MTDISNLSKGILRQRFKYRASNVARPCLIVVVLMVSFPGLVVLMAKQCSADLCTYISFKQIEIDKLSGLLIPHYI